MKTIQNERTIFVDIDDTLIMHLRPANASQEDRVLVSDDLTTNKIIVWRNNPMIRLLQEENKRGAYIVVWSRGGYKWAQDVITALNLNPAVDLIITKPFAYFDDKPVDEWMKDRVYLSPDTVYKPKTI